MIVIVDYGMGNLASIQNMLKKIGAASLISDKVNDIQTATKLILPGIGAFDQGMESLDVKGLIKPLTERVKDGGIPLLGVCLGMQLMGTSSEEGKAVGLGWVDAHSVRFVSPDKSLTQSFKVPHMGWNVVRPVREDILLKGLEERSRFYFVHSYRVVCDNPNIAIGMTPYGGEFVSMLRQKNIWGAQFHPEKSHRFGMQLLKNFVELA